MILSPETRAAHLSLLLEQTIDYAVILADAHSTITAVNDGALRLFGYAEEEIVGQSLKILFTAEDVAAGVPEIEINKTLQSGRAEDTRWHVKQDGSRFWVKGTATPLVDSAGTLCGVGKILRDHTDDKLLEGKIQRDRQELADMLESIGDGFMTLDRNYCVTYINSHTERLWQRTAREVLGKNLFVLFPTLLGESGAALRRAGQTGCIERTEVWSPTFQRWSDVSVYPQSNGGLSIFYRDVTARKNAEAALKQNLARQQHIATVLQRPLTLPIGVDVVPNFRLGSRYEAIRSEAEIGGDFADVIFLTPNVVAFVVADASGKGLEAATRAIQVREVLRAFLRESPGDAENAVARVNDFVMHTKEFAEQNIEGFLTLCLVVVNVESGAGTIVLAGAEPPVLLRANGAMELPGLPNLPLGVLRGETFASLPICLHRGDLLLLATDGLVEARREDEFLGLQRVGEMLQQIATAQAEATPQQITDRLIQETVAWMGTGFRDDVCLLLAERL